MVSMNQTYQNIKSGAQVRRGPDYRGQAVVVEGKRKRTIELDKFNRDYVSVDAEPEPVQLPTQTPAVSGLAPAFPVMSTLYRPSFSAKLQKDFAERLLHPATARQRTTIRGTLRSRMTMDEKEYLALAGSVPYCMYPGCGSTERLQNAHGGADQGKGEGMKGNGFLIARLCMEHHRQIDCHEIEDWNYQWTRAEQATRVRIMDIISGRES